MTQKRYIAHFTPQAWVGNVALPIQSQAPNEWDCTAYLYSLELEYRTNIINYLESEGWCPDLDDLFRYDENAPSWIQHWAGPFEIYLRPATIEDTL